MTAHIRPAIGLVVTFTRDGEERDRVIAPTGERALKAAIVLLAGLDTLQPNDRLTVEER
jgi:hypothetical protein